MILEISVAQCDGCGERVPADAMPDTWSTVQQGGQATRLFCSAACHGWGDTAGAVPHEQIIKARAARLGLLPRDIEVLDLLAEGLGDKMIANRLGLQPSTIKNRNGLLFVKLDVLDRLQAVLVAGHLGLVDLAAHGALIRRVSRS